MSFCFLIGGNSDYTHHTKWTELSNNIVQFYGNWKHGLGLNSLKRLNEPLQWTDFTFFQYCYSFTGKKFVKYLILARHDVKLFAKISPGRRFTMALFAKIPPGRRFAIESRSQRHYQTSARVFIRSRITAKYRLCNFQHDCLHHRNGFGIVLKLWKNAR